ncbi:Ulp1 protease family [Vigna unguiculata]|uniref:Ulp1 protease family n=1 Tax=Vigna unguiculata TaxID=3917 RepID=A0A4D6NE78_VIGUN|nr:Ulp1 protease family [Vigna unguiculata]
MARKGKKVGKKPDFDEEDRVRLINFVDTKHIVEINNVLIDGHRRRIGVTPFKWCLELERSVDICSPLLVELLRRWDDGSVVVLQIWAFERLGLGADDRDIVFPRILRWPTLKLRTSSIERLFIEPNLIFDWALTEEDQSNELVRVALNLTGVSEGGDRVSEGGEEPGVSNTGDVWLKKFHSNEIEIMEIKKRLKILEDEVFSRNESQPVEKDNVCDDKGQTSHCNTEKNANVSDHEVGEDVGEDFGALHEHEGHANEGNTTVDISDDSGVENEAEVGGDGNGKSPTLHDVPDNIYKDNPVPDVHCAELLAIIPWVAPSQGNYGIGGRVDVVKLYRTVTRVDCPYRIVAVINGQILSTHDCMGFRPMGYVCNMAVMFGCNLLMHNKRKLHQHVRRIVLHPMYTTSVVHDSNQRIAKRRVWKLSDYNMFFSSKLVSMKEILTAEFARNMETFLSFLLNCKEDNKPSFEIRHALTPIQPNLHDCGVIVLKFIELWDGSPKFNGNCMPEYTTEDL